MDKFRRDQFGEIFQDDLTENETKDSGPERDEQESEETLDPDVDSQDDDRTMAENKFGEDRPQSDNA